ncbi:MULTISPECIES: CdaR family transcriptional regulator [unclassified Gordonia (in: high G+C Gram-positive bacteria)]|uniref:PucR family transcriptional regulator n=1 Tax=unclassified Gordonia (in: high G+C Gram-positive bacteria) TaxID=2657482 RepID=UPI001F0D9592|nr:helix-turn-helix domain-containing protein [Gordonia sp. ABSL49_1]MCH5644745.1 helix-turn-helix domain-containing protein [Gordonia sp. ABSL49_1]
MSELGGWLEEFEATQRDPAAVEEWVTRTADVIFAGVDLPEDLHDVVRQAIAEHWLAFLGGITVSAAGTDDLVPAAHTLAVRVARGHLGLPVLLKIYQAAQEAAWDFAVEVVRGAPAELDHEALLVWFWSKATRWFGSSVELSVAVFSDEVERIRRRGDARRYELVAEVLAGRSVGPAELSAELGGHPVNGVAHVAVIAHAVDADSIERLEPAVTALAAGRRGARTVVVRPGGRELWAWFTIRGDAQPPLDEGLIDPRVMRVTVGGPALGYDGFIWAHRDARTAQRVALAPHRDEGVTRYSDVAALTMLALDHPAAERFSRSVLGELAESGNEHLHETIREVLTSSKTADLVAKDLGVHKNTVRYRTQQAERLLGRPLTERAGDLLLALDYFDAFLR